MQIIAWQKGYYNISAGRCGRVNTKKGDRRTVPSECQSGRAKKFKSKALIKARD